MSACVSALLFPLAPAVTYIYKYEWERKMAQGKQQSREFLLCYFPLRLPSNSQGHDSVAES